MFTKIDVNGNDASPLYAYLTSGETGIDDAGKVRWNFEKFLVSRDGKVLARFRTSVEPDSPEIVKAIEGALKGAS
jgi:glutathione peroxidase